MEMEQQVNKLSILYEDNMKLLYLMHVDWNWIKQRPHFIAEKLVNRGVNVDIFFQKDYRRNVLSKNYKGLLNPHAIPRLPLERIKIIELINSLIKKLFYFIILHINKYDYIYLTSPKLYNEEMANYNIIYDCMDDILAFPSNKIIEKILFEKERALIIKSKFTFFTSAYLKKTVLERYKLDEDSKKYLVNNNAVEIENLEIDKSYKFKINNKINFVYIGTIASWFDFDLIRTLSKMNYVFHLFGPQEENIDLPDNCVYHGVIPRSDIFSVMNEADILVMPFILNELIKSVNPVKIYEYIYSGKPIVCIRYDETEKFRDYVDLYESGDMESFINIVKNIEENNFLQKRTLTECQEYSLHNNWDKRVDDILSFIE